MPWSNDRRNSGVACSNGGFTFVYDPTSILVEPGSLRIALSTNLPVNIALANDADTTNSGAFAATPAIGLRLDVQIVLALVPVAELLQMQVIYLTAIGTQAGVQVGAKALHGHPQFELTDTSGMLLGGPGGENDSIAASTAGIYGTAIRNYGQILLAHGSDSIFAQATSPVNGRGTGILNWGVISTGNESGRRPDLADSITGIGEDCGIFNSTGAVASSTPPKILTGAGDDEIWGQARMGNPGIVNEGLVDMGSGDDRYKSSPLFFSPIVGIFAGVGTVVMGAGNDVVEGFGTGTYYGDGQGEVARSRGDAGVLTNHDSLCVPRG